MKKAGSKKPRPYRRHPDARSALAFRAYTSYKFTATKVRGYSWAITEQEFFALAAAPCHYCGAPPSNAFRHKKYGDSFFLYSGLDRKDNSKGYDMGNVVACCGRCNRIKREILTYDEMQAVGALLKELQQGVRAQSPTALALLARLQTILQFRTEGLREFSCGPR